VNEKLSAIGSRLSALSHDVVAEGHKLRAEKLKAESY
jgi:hypothetical protein